MTYFADVDDASMLYEALSKKDYCFECGKSIKKGVVMYDGYIDESTAKTISLHPACAAVLGQRLISDGYANRRNS
ncbi:hypothetical protein D3C76_1435750 [compost metagenome]